jgi:hypothetical protein
MLGMADPHSLPQPSKRLIGVRAVAATLGISRTAALALIVAGHLPHVELPAVATTARGRVMRRRLVDLADVEAFITARKAGA